MSFTQPRLNFKAAAIALIVILGLVFLRGGQGEAPARPAVPAASTLPDGLLDVVYEDGVFETEVSVERDAMLMVLFTPPVHPFIVRGASYYGGANQVPARVHLLSGAPPAGDLVPPKKLNSSAGWNTVFFDAPYRLESGGVFVGVESAYPLPSDRVSSGDFSREDGVLWVAGDTSAPVRGKTWVSVGDNITPIVNVVGVPVDAAIRLLGEVVAASSTSTTSTTSSIVALTSTTSTSSTTTSIDLNDVNISFKHEHGECGTTQNISLHAENNRIFFSGRAPAPTPCYILSASAWAKGNEIRIRISGRQEDRVCVFCRGAVPFSGEIRDLAVGGDYVVVFEFSGGASVSRDVQFNVTPSEVSESECATRNDCGVDYYGNLVCMSGRPARALYRNECVGGKCVLKADLVVDEHRPCYYWL